MPTPSVLVTGATGRVGAAILAQLTAAGVPVRAALRSPAALELPALAQPVPFDILAPATHAPALAGIRRLFLLWPPGTDARATIPPFLDAAVRAGVQQVVFLSVLGADRLKVVPHYAVERMLRASPLRWAILRPAYFFQNLSTTHCADIRDHDDLIVPAGRGRTAMVDVRDVAAVAADLLRDDHPNLALDLTSADAPTFDEVAALLSDALGRPIRYARPGLLRFLRLAPARGYSRGLTLFMAAEYTLTRLRLADHRSDHLARALGRPPITLARFIHDHRACWLRPT